MADGAAGGPVAETLARGDSRTVGIPVADIPNPYLAVLAKTIDEAARSKCFDIVLSVDGTPNKTAEGANG
jgi:DNA-binding LacI/PurR family transcriptional regulator